MSSLEQVALFSVLLVFLYAKEAMAATSVVCEHHNMVINCECGKTIRILDASYGRHTGNAVCPGPIGTTNCHAEWSTEKVRGACNQEQSCTVPVTNAVFGDPCGGTYKYLVVKYTCQYTNTKRIIVKKRHFHYKGERIFLSGMNQAWDWFAYDFGNGKYQQHKSSLEFYLKAIHNAGGNSIRFWLHVEGENTPHFNSNNYVIGLDQTGTMLKDMKSYLSLAKKYNIFVIFCLWNGALRQTNPNRLEALIYDENKLRSYINNALIPMVHALKSEPALGGWEIINEPEGKLNVDINDEDPCYNVQHLRNQGPGWAGKLYSMRQILKFINWQAFAIHVADPEALVTVGSWNWRANSDRYGASHHYRDHCLIKAGGLQQGYLDYYQIHQYQWGPTWGPNDLFKVDANHHSLDKPIVIGEFSQLEGAGMDITEMFRWAYYHGYAGAWSWHARGPAGDGSDDLPTQERGCRALQNKNEQNYGGRVNVVIG